MPEFLPRRREERDVQVTRRVVSFEVEFNKEQILEALLEKYGNTPVGPESVTIPPDCQVLIGTKGVLRVKLSWDEDPERIKQLERPQAPTNPNEHDGKEAEPLFPPKAKKPATYDSDFDG